MPSASTIPIASSGSNATSGSATGPRETVVISTSATAIPRTALATATTSSGGGAPRGTTQRSRPPRLPPRRRRGRGRRRPPSPPPPPPHRHPRETQKGKGSTPLDEPARHRDREAAARHHESADRAQDNDPANLRQLAVALGLRLFPCRHRPLGMAEDERRPCAFDRRRT